MNKKQILHVSDDYSELSPHCYDFEEVAKQEEGPGEIDDLNVHLTRKVTGHWMAKKEVIRDRTAIKPKLLKHYKKQNKKRSNASRRINRK